MKSYALLVVLYIVGGPLGILFFFLFDLSCQNYSMVRKITYMLMVSITSLLGFCMYMLFLRNVKY